MNGIPVIRIGRKGRRLIAFGEGEPFEVDVVGVANAYTDVVRAFHDDNGRVPPERNQELNGAALEFVKQISGQADLSMAEALEFLKVITEEQEKLKGFFALKSEGAPPSPASSELIFSTEK